MLSLVHKTYPVMQSLFDVGIFSLEMEIMENKEEPGEIICWRAQGQEEGMDKFLKWCAKQIKLQGKL